MQDNTKGLCMEYFLIGCLIGSFTANIIFMIRLSQRPDISTAQNLNELIKSGTVIMDYLLHMNSRISEVLLNTSDIKDHIEKQKPEPLVERKVNNWENIKQAFKRPEKAAVDE